MALPTDDEYQTALQNPSSAFEDPELKAGRPELISPTLPLPRARSGNFATVYRMNCSHRSWAVRCFTRSIHPDQRVRYEEIGKHLAATNSRYSVGFTFVEHGIRIRDDWFPIVKMEWVHGESLGRYVEKHLGDRVALLALAAKWVDMVVALRRDGVAHGDLQHGNVLVVGSELRLVDYDGMFVPALRGRSSYEQGHENYQHPNRGDLFGPQLDNFSSWVIFLSLLALAHDPSLWTQFNRGGECLLFRKTDYADPDTSPVVAALVGAREARVRSLATLFRSLLYLPAEQVPALDSGALLPPAPKPAIGAGWVGEHLRPVPVGILVATASGTDEARVTPTTGPGWVLDFLEARPPGSPWQGRSFKWERVAVALSGVVTLGLLSAVAAGAVSPFFLAMAPLLAGVLAAAFVHEYRRDPVWQERALALRLLGEAEFAANTSQAEVLAMQRNHQRAEAEAKRCASAHEALRKSVESRRYMNVAGLRTEYRDKTTLIAGKRKEVDRKEEAALRGIQTGLRFRLQEDQRKSISELASREQSELLSALAKAQDHHVTLTLCRASIAAASIPGIGQTLTDSLIAAGVRTAVDVSWQSVQRVSGIGPSRVAALEVWRRVVEEDGRRTIPIALDSGTVATIRGQYATTRVQLERELGLAVSSDASEIESVKRQAQHDRGALVIEEQGANADFATAERAAHGSAAAEIAKCESDSATADAEARDARRVRVESLNAARAESLQLQWKREAARREAAAYSSASFWIYVARIMGGGDGHT